MGTKETPIIPEKRWGSGKLGFIKTFFNISRGTLGHLFHTHFTKGWFWVPGLD